MHNEDKGIQLFISIFLFILFDPIYELLAITISTICGDWCFRLALATLAYVIF